LCSFRFPIHVMYVSLNAWFSEDIRINQDRQCTYNVTVRRLRATIVVVGKKPLLEILSVRL